AGWIAAGMALGSLVASTQKHPRRVLGFVPWGSLGLTVCLVWLSLLPESDIPSETLCVIFGVMAGLVNVPLATAYQIALPPDARGNGMAVRNMTDYLVAAVTAAVLFAITQTQLATPTLSSWLLAAAVFLATLAGFWIFRREVTEQIIEVVFAFMYR